MAVLGLLLAACSAGSILTDSGSSTVAEPKGKTVPPVAIQEIRGIPPGQLDGAQGLARLSGRPP